MKNKRKPHDNAYKKLFLHPETLRQLLVYFSGEDFVKELNYETMEIVNKSFVDEKFSDRESDMIYKLKYKEEDFYIYVLLEFQSTVDRFMSQRVLRYILDFYDELKEKENIKQLPPVLPVVLYNGNRKWTAPVNFQELVSEGIPKKYIPDFNYLGIFINEFKEKSLLKVNNLVSALFLAENVGKEEMLEILDAIVIMITDEKPELNKILKNWLFHIFQVDKSEIIDKFNSIEEEETNMGLAETVKEWYADAREEVREEERAKFEKEREKYKKEKAETVKKMLSDNVDPRMISRYTGLTLEEIEKYRKM